MTKPQTCDIGAGAGRVMPIIEIGRQPLVIRISHMTTGKKPAHYASKELSSKKSPKSEKMVAGSALSQARKPKRGK